MLYHYSRALSAWNFTNGFLHLSTIIPSLFFRSLYDYFMNNVGKIFLCRSNYIVFLIEEIWLLHWWLFIKLKKINSLSLRSVFTLNRTQESLNVHRTQNMVHTRCTIYLRVTFFFYMIEIGAREWAEICSR